MDPAGIFRLPTADDDQRESDLREVEVAIEMVARGAARRILIGLWAADEIAPIALARAQGAGVDFHIERDGSATRLTFGPRD